MYDKFDIEVPFKREHVHVLHALHERAGYVDFKNYDFPAVVPVFFENGQVHYGDAKTKKFETLSSGISGMAVAFYPEGNGFNQWPHIRLKASPAKILQGHNVFGSENPRHGIAQMFANLSIGFKKIYEHLDLDAATIRYIDVTYSARIKPFFSRSVFSLFESLANGKRKVNARYTDKGYLQLGEGSEYVRQKLYVKSQEVLDDLADAKRRNHFSRVEILSNPKLLDFTIDLHRFEATIGHRKMIDIGIPVRVQEFLKFNDWFLQTHKTTLCQYLWEIAFNPLFEQIAGHTMKNVDDSEIKLRIDAKYIKVKDNGRVCRRLANAVFNTYNDLKREGYESLSKINNKTFFRNVNYLIDIGLSRAFLKSLDPFKPNDNVIPLVQLIKIDFNNQRPDWYVEPTSGYSDPRLIPVYERPQLRVVA